MRRSIAAIGGAALADCGCSCESRSQGHATERARPRRCHTGAQDSRPPRPTEDFLLVWQDWVDNEWPFCLSSEIGPAPTLHHEENSLLSAEKVKNCQRMTSLTASSFLSSGLFYERRSVTAGCWIFEICLSTATSMNKRTSFLGSPSYRAFTSKHLNHCTTFLCPILLKSEEELWQCHFLKLAVPTAKMVIRIRVAGLGETNELTDVNTKSWHTRNVTDVGSCENGKSSLLSYRHDQLLIPNFWLSK